MKKIFYIKMNGDLDTLNIKPYNEKITTIIDTIEEPSILLLGFEEVTYINSTAIGNIADWYNKLDENDSEVIIISINDEIMETLNLVGLGDRIDFFDDMDEFKLAYKD